MPLTSDYLQVNDNTQEAALMHVTNSRSPSATTIEVDTVAGVPAFFIATYGVTLPSGFIDPSSAVNFYGHLSGSDLEIDGFLPGSSDSGNEVGDVVVIRPSGFWANFVAQLSKDAYDRTTNILTGWLPLGATLTYASADTAAGGSTSTNGVSTYTATISGDYSGIISKGMRFKLSQTTEKFFLVTRVVFATGTTTITLFGGTDYSLANATITDPYFSMAKAPYGFPTEPSKWTVETKITSAQTQSNPTTFTWYNVGSVQLAVPIGDWIVEYWGTLRRTAASGTPAMYSTLSTANNTESDVDFTTQNAAAVLDQYYSTGRRKAMSVTSKTQMYFNLRSGGAQLTNAIINAADAPFIIRAISPYL